MDATTPKPLANLITSIRILCCLADSGMAFYSNKIFKLTSPFAIQTCYKGELVQENRSLTLKRKENE